jgi:hypothetical protein
VVVVVSGTGRLRRGARDRRRISPTRFPPELPRDFTANHPWRGSSSGARLNDSKKKRALGRKDQEPDELPGCLNKAELDLRLLFFQIGRLFRNSTVDHRAEVIQRSHLQVGQFEFV